MTRNSFHRAFTLIKLVAIMYVIMAMPAMAGQVLIGPPDPDAEQGMDDWNHGTGGTGYQSIDDTDPSTGADDFTLGNTNAARENHADWRSQIFPLGNAAAGVQPVTFSFSYKLTDTVNDGDNIRVQLRFYDKAGNFIEQNEFLVGSSSKDSEMIHYKKLTFAGIRPPRRAQGADVTFSANFYDIDRWSSGTARFDDFSVTTASRFPLFKGVVAPMLLLLVAGLIAWFIRQRSRQK
ncbi:MAG TPA: hypothetical protein VGH42_03920 [Verrucomicrobiae bacterium]